MKICLIFENCNSLEIQLLGQSFHFFECQLKQQPNIYYLHGCNVSLLHYLHLYDKIKYYWLWQNLSVRKYSWLWKYEKQSISHNYVEYNYESLWQLIFYWILTIYNHNKMFVFNILLLICYIERNNRTYWFYNLWSIFMDFIHVLSVYGIQYRINVHNDS